MKISLKLLDLPTSANYQNHDYPSSSFKKKVILKNNQKGNHPFLPKHFASLDIKI